MEAGTHVPKVPFLWRARPKKQTPVLHHMWSKLDQATAKTAGEVFEYLTQGGPFESTVSKCLAAGQTSLLFLLRLLAGHLVAAKRDQQKNSMVTGDLAQYVLIPTSKPPYNFRCQKAFWGLDISKESSSCAAKSIIIVFI